MNEKNEKKTPKSENEQVLKPSSQSEIPGPPVESVNEMEVNQSEQDLDLLKNKLEAALPLDDIFQEEILEEIVEETFPEETVFKYPVDGMEKTAYENILKANRETIKSLRLQVQEKTTLISALEAELEAKGTKE